MFPVNTTSQEIQQHIVRDFPSLYGLVREGPPLASPTMHRRKFRVDKFRKMVRAFTLRSRLPFMIDPLPCGPQLAFVEQVCKVRRFGAAVDAFWAAQEHGETFHSMTESHPAFHALHAGDAEAYVRLLAPSG